MQTWRLPGAGGEESREFLFNWYRVSVWEDGKAVEMKSGDDCTTV